jgi:neurotransmitter:Na+ symporter, NSS family
MSTERFGSRFAFLAAAIGMAVGAGNIWRFPRVAAEWGGGTFLIVCVLVALVWAVPLLMAESYMGSKSRLGTIGAFRDFAGRRFTWMGGFVTFVTLGITFYYAVVCGWALRYFLHSLTGAFADPAMDTQAVWDGFTSSPAQTITFHVLAILLIGVIVARGLKGGFESVLKVALPVSPLCVAGGVVITLLAKVPECIDRVELCLCREQRLLLVLAMDVHESPRQALKLV